MKYKPDRFEYNNSLREWVKSLVVGRDLRHAGRGPAVSHNSPNSWDTPTKARLIDNSPAHPL
jgi:hypothetical protein